MDVGVTGCARETYLHRYISVSTIPYRCRYILYLWGGTGRRDVVFINVLPAVVFEHRYILLTASQGATQYCCCVSLGCPTGPACFQSHPIQRLRPVGSLNHGTYLHTSYPRPFVLISFIYILGRSLVANWVLMSTAPRDSHQFPILLSPPDIGSLCWAVYSAGHSGHRVASGLIHSRGNSSAFLSPPRIKAGAGVLRAAHLKGVVCGTDAVVSTLHHAGALG